MAYFDGHPNFLHIDIEREGKAAWKKLNSHLNCDLVPKWDNRQQKKSNPEWVKTLLKKSEVRAAKCNSDYPAISGSSLSDRLFLAGMRVLSKDFIKERHLVKNIKDAVHAYKWHQLSRYGLIAEHLGRFVRVLACLVLRVAVTRSRRLSPFIY